MRHLLALPIVLAASAAAAQPMAREDCAVNIVRAPDDVRVVVERWVKAEPRCNAKLEIRIVTTDGGLYLLARDDSGRVRERVVPDAQSAGVLVASWVAADSMGAPTPYDVRQPAPEPAVATGPASAPAPVVAPAPQPMPPSAMIGTGGLLAPGEGAAPGASPVVATATVTATAPAPAAPRQRWLSLAGLVAMSGTGGGGIRAEWDLASRRMLTFGLATSATQSGRMIYGATYEGTGRLDTFDGKLIGYASVSGERGHWHLRAALGAGVVFTTAILDQPTMDRSASGIFPTGEVSLTVGRDLGSSWALHMGPIVSLYAQEFQSDTTAPGYYAQSTQRRDLEAMMSFALRYRL